MLIGTIRMKTGEMLAEWFSDGGYVKKALTAAIGAGFGHHEILKCVHDTWLSTG